MERTRGDDAMEGTRLTKHLGGIALAALFAVALAVSPAWAATFNVPSAATPTIQSALCAAKAAAGGPHTIKIAKGGGTGNYGAYHEEGLVVSGPTFPMPAYCSGGATTGAGHTGLSIICEKGAVIDGGIPTGREGFDTDGTPHVGPFRMWGHGLRVFQTDDVTVKRCTFRGWRRDAGRDPPFPGGD